MQRRLKTGSKALSNSKSGVYSSIYRGRDNLGQEQSPKRKQSEDSKRIFSSEPKMSILTKAADLAHRATVLGLGSLLGYQIYQIGYNVTEKLNEPKVNSNQHADIMKKISDKVAEESQDKDKIDKIPDRYDPDDNSYLKKVPKLN